jgi:hypothetical protein
MTTGLKQRLNVAIASLLIDTDRGTVPVQDALVDTGGSKNLASRNILTEIRLAESYGNKPIRMVTVNGRSPDYTQSSGRTIHNGRKRNSVSHPMLCSRTAHNGP